jgi:hypothetical protein
MACWPIIFAKAESINCFQYLQVFFVKTQKTFAFHFIEKIEVYNPPRRHITTELQVFSGHPRLMAELPLDLWRRP